MKATHINYALLYSRHVYIFFLLFHTYILSDSTFLKLKTTRVIYIYLSGLCSANAYDAISLLFVNYLIKSYDERFSHDPKKNGNSVSRKMSLIERTASKKQVYMMQIGYCFFGE